MTKQKRFHQIYSTHWYQLFGYCYNIIRDKESAEDVIQEVFIDFWNRFDDIEINNYKAYLYKAVKFQCAKKLKKATFNQIQIEKIEHVLTLLEDNNISYAQTKESLLRSVQDKAKEILPDKCFQVFKLRYYENLSYSEISNKLNISTSTVDNHLNKALKLLRTSDISASEMLVFLLIILFTNA